LNPTRNRSSIIYLLLFVAIISMVVYNFQQQASTQEVLSINQVATDVQKGIVDRLVEDDNRLRVVYKDGSERSSHMENNATIVEQLKELGVTTDQLASERIKLDIKPPSAWLGIATALGYICHSSSWQVFFGLSSARRRAATMPPFPLGSRAPVCLPVTSPRSLSRTSPVWRKPKKS